MKKRMKLLIFTLCLVMSIAVLTACGGPNEKDFSDNTGELESSAMKGSLDTIQGKYYEDGLEGNYVVFGESGEGFTSQHGSYEIKDGEIALSYDVSGIPMDYSITASDSDENLVALINGNIELNCSYKNGTAGLHNAKDNFTGTYSVDDGTDIVFNEDGTFRQVMPFTYTVKGDQLTETFDDSEVTFTWEKRKGKILLIIDDQTVQTLVPAK